MASRWTRSTGLLTLGLSLGLFSCGGGHSQSSSTAAGDQATQTPVPKKPKKPGGGNTPGNPDEPIVPPPETPNELPSEPLPPPPPPLPKPVYRLDSSLQVSETQFKGTHNSYHVRPSTYTSPSWEYDMPPLVDQLNKYGVRAFEIDVHWTGSRFAVYHWPDDPNSTCAFLEDCLGQLNGWSAGHQGHAPLVIFLDLKYDEGSDTIVDHLEDLENTVANAWPRERNFVPDDLTGDLPDVATAIRQRGWPALSALRGKAIIALLVTDGIALQYAHNDTDLHGRRMFIASGNTNIRHVGIAAFDEAEKYESYIEQAAHAGYLVRTRADDLPAIDDPSTYPARFQAALASGAHIIMTDYPVPYTISGYDTTIPGGTPERCNPVTARPDCSSDQIENPELLVPAPVTTASN